MEASKGTPDGQLSGSGARVAIADAAGLLGGLTLLSRVAGLGRDVVIGALFGASASADAFFVAFRIPNLFRRVVAEGASSTAFVPVFTSRLVEGGRPAALASAGAVGRAAGITLSLIVVVGVLFADEVVGLFAPGFAADPDKRALTVQLTAWTFPYLLLVGMGAWAMGTLHTFKRFAAPAFGPILLNLAIIASALALSGVLERPVFALVVGVLIGGLLQFGVQLPALWREGLRPQHLIKRGDAAVRRVGALLIPTIFGGAVYQINIIVATILASLLPERSVSYLWYADRVFEFPLGIIAVAIGTAALPSLAEQTSAKHWDGVADSLSYSLRLVWALCIPATVGLWLLAPAIVEVLFERGEFGTTDTAQTAWALRAYVVGLLGVASVRVLVSLFYALEEPRIPVTVASLALVVNGVVDIAFMGPTDPSAQWWGAALFASVGERLAIVDLRHAGLALGTSVAATVNALVLFVLARRRLASFGDAKLLRCVAIHGAASAVMAVVVVAGTGFAETLAPDSSALLAVTIVVPLAMLVYGAATFYLGSREMRDLLAVVTRRRA